MTLYTTVRGSLTCTSGVLIVSGSGVYPDMAGPDWGADCDECYRVPVRPGRYLVEYVWTDDAPVLVPEEVVLRHEAAAAAPFLTRLRLWVEGNDITVADASRVADPRVCEALKGPRDAVWDDSGIAIATHDYGRFEVLTDGGAVPATTLRVQVGARREAAHTAWPEGEGK